mmetsp:Transcript_6709/g.7703  ORF Transcript_6709/g.7703 Transcript_6709/m.7703 type:complete len:505 (+) Transcript_6709:258-1772(+)|eukprot:CAMPEP_0184013194 /NCGR_PEP_ID=MMETSP0954-20121128/4872_1 /TAXON_ID=627963 /ORGANISM="Aplanochytrium sp, Strain PBS07" /LENGTH=504 /DNA_ID=CAMNT_0026293345 /DNA_START=300 /DNA_END=1814 /DNA_ORIENTATION=-
MDLVVDTFKSLFRKGQTVYTIEEKGISFDVSKQPIQLGVFVYPGYELLDTYGPLEMFGVCNYKSVTGRKLFDIHIIGENGVTDMGPKVVSDFAPGDSSIPKLDILFIPGGNGWEAEMEREESVNWLSKAIEEAKVVISVCNGAGVLATLGSLNGKRATTNKMDMCEMQERFPEVNWVEDARWVDDGKFFTSSGVAAGMDLTVSFISQLVSPKVGKKVTEFAEYVAATEASPDPFVSNMRGFEEEIKRCQPAELPEEYTVGVLLYDNFELLDVFGSLEMFACANRSIKNKKLFKLITIGETEIVKSSKGPFFKVSHPGGFNSSTANEIDILFIPGGMGTLREVHNPRTLNWIRQAAEEAKIVFTVCSGSAVLAKAGCLDGKTATTNKILYRQLVWYGPNVNWQEKARYCIDGKFYTSSGVSAGTDLGLRIIADLVNDEFADIVARRAEYVRCKEAREDPFAYTTPPNGIAQKAGVVATGLTMRAMFGLGFKLGYDMNTSEVLSFL